MAAPNVTTPGGPVERPVIEAAAPRPVYTHAAPAAVLILAGGVIYTLGAVGFVTARPPGRPASFGYHEFFHAATVAAAVCHYIAFWLVLHPGPAGPPSPQLR